MAKKKNGGVRLGAGRKAGPLGILVTEAIRIPPIVREFFQTLESRGKFVTAKIMESKEFRQWRKESGK